MSEQQSPTSFDEESGAVPLAGCGCSALLLLAGGLLMLVALDVLPNREQFYGDVPFWIGLVVGGAFFLTGVLLLFRMLFPAGRASPSLARWVFNAVLLLLILPFHFWLFSGRGVVGSELSVILPIGTFFASSGESLWVTKVMVGVLVLLVDLYLLSEVVGLGWFETSSMGKD